MTRTFNNLMRPKRERVWEIDFLRGLAIALVIVDHFISIDLYYMLPYVFEDYYSFDFLVSFVNLGEWYTVWPVRVYLRWFFICVFLVTAGISTQFSRNNVLRAAELWFVALAITLVTSLLELILGESLGVTFTIYFGIIHMMAFSVTLAALIKKIFKYDIYYLVFGLLIVLSYFLALRYKVFVYGSDGMPKWIDIKSARDLVNIAIGFFGGGEDWFSIFPYTGMILIGAYVGKRLYPTRRSLLPKLDGRWNKGYAAIGRKTLWVYVLHQPLMLLLLVVIGLLGGATLAI